MAGSLSSIAPYGRWIGLVPASFGNKTLRKIEDPVGVFEPLPGPPPPEPVVPLPDPEAQGAARKRAIAQRRSGRGRASTIFTEDGGTPLGG